MALVAGSVPARARIASSTPGDWGDEWRTTQIGAGNSWSSAATMVRSASIPPADAPMTTMCFERVTVCLYYPYQGRQVMAEMMDESATAARLEDKLLLVVGIGASAGGIK